MENPNFERDAEIAQLRKDIAAMEQYVAQLVATCNALRTARDGLIVQRDTLQALLLKHGVHPK